MTDETTNIPPVDPAMDPMAPAPEAPAAEPMAPAPEAPVEGDAPAV